MGPILRIASMTPARVADCPAPRWRACWCSVRRRARLQPAVRQVLVLQSFDRGNLVLDHFTGNFRVDLDQRAGQPVNVVQVVVGPTGSVGAPEQAIVDLHPIHLRRSSQAGPHRDGRAAPPRSSRASIDSSSFPTRRSCSRPSIERFLRDAPLGENETAVAVVNDFPATHR